MKSKIVVTHWVHAETIERLSGSGRVVTNETRETWPREQLMREVTDATALMAFMPDAVDAAFLSAAPKLKMIACALKGFDNFDLAACEKAGVMVSIVPDLLTEPTAELAIGLAIGVGRQLRAGDTLVRSGEFKGWRPVLYGMGLNGATVAIVGFGAVGRAIAAKLPAFGATVIAVDPRAAPYDGVEFLPLKSALARADFVIMAAPLTPDTRHIINA
ncbi:MAG: NAD(P)-dependent oxidoreductase, partial [Alphaproteobacteria bacterium]